MRPSDEKDDNVTTRKTNDRNWQRGESCAMTDVTTATTRDYQSDNQNMTPMTLMTTGD